MKLHIVQHIYLFFLLAFYGFSVVIRSLLNVIYGEHFTPMSVLLKAHRVFEVFMSLFFISMLLLFPLYQSPNLRTLAVSCSCSWWRDITCHSSRPLVITLRAWS
ncbi:Uncharacterized protein FKW44_002848 [Caligus rogercresseyi]|uniref:Uncharacterized protein n=1 Tax=Caligus rogercresseyi TaxID=217165 RepID=A0A7T8KL58_CALRO|nr:Uncharacterized protein FKW44_002848 [Caligus rogercresseyi]